MTQDKNAGIIYNLLVLQSIYVLLHHGRAHERIVPVTKVK